MGWLSRLGRSRPPALVLGLLAVLCCAAALAAPTPASHTRRFDPHEVSARRAPVFGWVPISRRDEAVLRSQPDVQLLGVGTTAGRSKLARLKVARNRRPVAGPARRGAGGDGDRRPARPSDGTAVRLRAPPSPV